jgi:hypothetical protein
VGPGTASAATKDLWATVNVCDPPSARNVIGIRSSMPGNGTQQRMFMHFSADWYSAAKKRWLPTGSSSPWMRVGTARYVSTQAGYSFQFADPPQGTRFMMRGVVRYEWRARTSGRVLKRAMRVTKGGYKGVVGSVPAGRSDAACAIEY